MVKKIAIATITPTNTSKHPSNCVKNIFSFKTNMFRKIVKGAAKENNMLFLLGPILCKAKNNNVLWAVGQWGVILRREIDTMQMSIRKTGEILEDKS